jgi:hypothetical protein
MITIFWYVTLCSVVEIYKNISEGNTASIFTVEEQVNELAQSKHIKAYLAYSSTLKMEAVTLCKVSVNSHQITRCHIPENIRPTFHDH